MENLNIPTERYVCRPCSTVRNWLRVEQFAAAAMASQRAGISMGHQRGRLTASALRSVRLFDGSVGLWHLRSGNSDLGVVDRCQQHEIPQVSVKGLSMTKRLREAILGRPC